MPVRITEFSITEMRALTKEVSNRAPSSRSAKMRNDVSPSARTTPWRALHQTLANQNMQSRLRTGVIQAKLRVNQPNDLYEQEAELAGKGKWDSVDEQTLDGTWGAGASRADRGIWYMKKV